jgi:hypothetical protein
VTGWSLCDLLAGTILEVGEDLIDDEVGLCAIDANRVVTS